MGLGEALVRNPRDSHRWYTYNSDHFEILTQTPPAWRDKDSFWPRLELAEICPLKERFASLDLYARRRESLTKLRSGALMKSQAQGNAGETASAPEGKGDTN